LPHLLTVYSREDCHLCQDMLTQLLALRESLGFELRTVDVDADSALQGRYGEWVPVLTGANEEICHYFLDRAALDAYLAKIR
jgi:glutaredoxin